MFFNDILRFGDNTALIENQRQISYRQLQHLVDQLALQIGCQGKSEPQLVMLKAGNNIDSIVAYLACLQYAQPLLLIDQQISKTHQAKLMQRYAPNVLVDSGQIQQLGTPRQQFDPRLALLLSTSGSTGSPKQVGLSTDNLQANASAISQYLPILASDKTITTLALFYSYGLSVLNSHLLSGATIVLTEQSLISREFWDLFEQHQINSFAGVPYSYEMLLRLGFHQKNLPHLRYFTQAGGKLSVEKVTTLAQYAQQQGKQFFVMYGQTEATARMAFNPEPLAKPDSIGQAIPGGELALLDKQGQLIVESNQQGELVYCGDNVMLGYAHNINDLAQFTPSELLATGDLAYRDEQGDYFINGRLKRFIKPFGVRLNLDEVEALLADNLLTVAVVGNDHKLQIGVQKNNQKPNEIKMIQQMLSQQLSLHSSVIQLVEFDVLPLTASGKRDYAMLQTWFDDK